jgi:hypothetical protein
MINTPSASPAPGQADAAMADSDVLDIQVLLNDLNLDALLAGLEAEPEPVAPPAAPAAVQEAPENSERRASRRLTAQDLGREVRLTIPGASQTALVNISETGALVETTRRLCPGKTTDVFVRLDGERRPMRVTIIRSTLHTLVPVPIYRTALHFDKNLPLSV